MTPQEALKIVTQVCAAHRGTLQDHLLFQQALDVLEQVIRWNEPQTQQAEQAELRKISL